MTITFELHHQVICRTDSMILASGSKGYVTARFDLITEDWTAPITALFNDYAVVLDGENQCTVPWEVLANPGKVAVSAFCGDLHTATSVLVPVHPSGYIEGQTPKPPTPSIYQELTALAEEAMETAADVKRRADAGEFDGDPGPMGPEGPKGQDGTVTFDELTEEQKESLKGQDGADGQDGKSAYAYAQEGGFTGTEEEFAKMLADEYPTFSDLRAAAPHNLLDNSDFRNPIAQAGVGGKHGSEPYAVDRWILTSGTVSLQTNVGLTLNGTITQKLETSPMGDVSAFVGMASGTATIQYSGKTVTITSDGGTIKWAALYEGNYTEETMPEYRPKGAAYETQVCLRYFETISNVNAIVYSAYELNAPTVFYHRKYRSFPSIVFKANMNNNEEGYVSESYGGEWGLITAAANPSRPTTTKVQLSGAHPGSIVRFAVDVIADIL